MFQVNRYNPEAPAKQRKKKRARNSKDAQEQEDKPTPALKVIAEEQEEITRSSKTLRSSEEAFDDLDLLEEFIEEPQPRQRRDAGSNLHTAGEDDAAAHQSKQDDDSTTIEAAQRMAALPIDEAARGWKMAAFLVENLKRQGFEHFFPIQALAIPDVLASERHAHVRARDVCVTAPTGSGKTLSYVLPILNALASKQQSHSLRALVVLPSRDLATQVHRVFDEYVTGSKLKVGLAIGQSDFVAEQKALTVDEKSTDIDMLLNRLSYDPSDLQLALKVSRLRRSSAGMRVPANGWSNVDILVCTPGRLVDHLDKTKGFTLQHLRFLVVDEADRLLSQSYHNWIDRVLEASNSASTAAWKGMKDGNLPPFQMTSDQQSVRIEPITWRRGGAEGDRSDHFNTNDGSLPASVCRPIQLRKFLVSATLTRDPQKLASLRLVNAKHFNVHSMKGDKKYAMPTTLKEYTVECTAEQKPLVLLSLLLDRLQQSQQQQKTVIVVFTASLDSTHRLARLLQLLWAANQYGRNVVGEFSSALSQSQRAALVQRCNNTKDPLAIVVCSDGMSRGMDLDAVDTVINYDVPTLAKTYLHRCGRTARGSREGTAISLLKGGQVSLFRRMRHLIQQPDRIQALAVKKSLVRDAVGTYRPCMQALRVVLDAEENGALGHSDTIDDYLHPGDIKMQGEP